MNPRTDETPGGGPGDSGDRQGSGSSASVPPTGDNSPYQLLPELTPTEYAALDREEIERAIAHVDMWIANLRSYIDVGCRLLIETGMPEAAAGALADRVWDDMSTAILNPADDNAADLFNARSGSFFELVQTMVDTAGDRHE